MLKFNLSLSLSFLSHCNCLCDPGVRLLFFRPEQDMHFNLTNSLKFRRSKSITSSSCVPSIDSSEKLEAVVCFFQTLGLSDKQIQSSLKLQPSLLSLDVEKNLKPTVAFYNELGLCGPHLATIISKNPSVLTSSLEKKLRPSIGVIKEALEHDGSAKTSNDVCDLMFRVLSRYAWFIANDSRLDSNMAYLRSCGVTDSQLIMLLKTEPRLISLPEAQLIQIVSRATEMGFAMGSKMLVYGIWALYGNSAETTNRKFELMQSFGFSRDECNEAFVKAPLLLKTSEAKLSSAIEFFLQTLKLEKSAIKGSPQILMFSMEKRVVPRYKILEVIKSRSLRQGAEFYYCVASVLPDKKFAKKYISRFSYDAQVLQVAYENHLLESSKG